MDVCGVALELVDEKIVDGCLATKNALQLKISRQFHLVLNQHLAPFKHELLPVSLAQRAEEHYLRATHENVPTDGLLACVQLFQLLVPIFSLVFQALAEDGSAVDFLLELSYGLPQSGLIESQFFLIFLSDLNLLSDVIQLVVELLDLGLHSLHLLFLLVHELHLWPDHVVVHRVLDNRETP